MHCGLKPKDTLLHIPQCPGCRPCCGMWSSSWSSFVFGLFLCRPHGGGAASSVVVVLDLFIDPSALFHASLPKPLVGILTALMLVCVFPFSRAPCSVMCHRSCLHVLTLLPTVMMHALPFGAPRVFASASSLFHASAHVHQFSHIPTFGCSH